jgi:hypothetical protein
MNRILLSVLLCLASISMKAQTPPTAPGGLRTSQAIAFTAKDGVVGTTQTLTALATSKLPVTFSSRTLTKCTVNGSTLSLIASGVCTLVASQAGDSYYIPGQTPYQINVLAKVVQTPLTVTLSEPRNAAVFTTNKPITVTAVTTGDSVTRVKLYGCGALIAEPLTAPYTASFTPTVAAAKCEVYAEVISSVTPFMATSAKLSIVVENPVEPTRSVSVVVPSTAVVGTAVNLTATTIGVTDWVDFYVDGLKIVRSTTAPYNATWTPTKPGAVDILVEASIVGLNGSGYFSKTARVTVSAAPVQIQPTIDLISPTEGMDYAVGSPILFSSIRKGPASTYPRVGYHACGDDLGNVTTEPYTLTFVPTKTYTNCIVYAETQSPDGSVFITTPLAIKINIVAASTIPTVTLTQPVTGSTPYVTQPIKLTAVTSSGTGVVNQVSFAVNGVALSTATLAPYEATWTPNQLGINTIVVSSTVTDNKGVQKVYSTTSSFNVVSAPVPWTVQQKFFAACQKCPSTQMFETTSCPGYTIVATDGTACVDSANCKWLAN